METIKTLAEIVNDYKGEQLEVNENTTFEDQIGRASCRERV